MVYQVGSDFPLEDWAVYPLQGDFTFTQLADWYGRFREDRWKLQLQGESSEYLSMVNIPGSSHNGPLNLTYAGTYPEMNRVLFRIKPSPDAPAVRKALEERLAALDVPAEAVIIAIQPSGR